MASTTRFAPSQKVLGSPRSKGRGMPYPACQVSDQRADEQNIVGNESAKARFRRTKSQLAKSSSAAAVHLLRLDEIVSLFRFAQACLTLKLYSHSVQCRDICCGLQYLHENNVLHLDLKADNVLLHWSDDDSLLPRALLSDFGSSESRSRAWQRSRSGGTGTLDYLGLSQFTSRRENSSLDDSQLQKLLK